jgi:hypothetical protein
VLPLLALLELATLFRGEGTKEPPALRLLLLLFLLVGDSAGANNRGESTAPREEEEEEEEKEASAAVMVRRRLVGDKTREGGRADEADDADASTEVIVRRRGDIWLRRGGKASSLTESPCCSAATAVAAAAEAVEVESRRDTRGVVSFVSATDATFALLLPRRLRPASETSTARLDARGARSLPDDDEASSSGC